MEGMSAPHARLRWNATASVTTFGWRKCMKKAFGLQVPENLQDIVQSSRCGFDRLRHASRYRSSNFFRVRDPKAMRLACERCAQGWLENFSHTSFLPASAAAGVASATPSNGVAVQEEPQETKCFIPQGSPAFQIVPELEPREGEVIVDKITMSAFEGTFLNLAMRTPALTLF